MLQDNLSRFKKDLQYQVDRKEDILIFFGEFSDYLSEDEMWTLSETIKPRGSSKKQWRRVKEIKMLLISANVKNGQSLNYDREWVSLKPKNKVG